MYPTVYVANLVQPLGTHQYDPTCQTCMWSLILLCGFSSFHTTHGVPCRGWCVKKNELTSPSCIFLSHIISGALGGLDQPHAVRWLRRSKETEGQSVFPLHGDRSQQPLREHINSYGSSDSSNSSRSCTPTTTRRCIISCVKRSDERGIRSKKKIMRFSTGRLNRSCNPLWFFVTHCLFLSPRCTVVS